MILHNVVYWRPGPFAARHVVGVVYRCNFFALDLLSFPMKEGKGEFMGDLRLSFPYSPVGLSSQSRCALAAWGTSTSCLYRWLDHSRLNFHFNLAFVYQQPFSTLHDCLAQNRTTRDIICSNTSASSRGKFHWSRFWGGYLTWTTIYHTPTRLVSQQARVPSFGPWWFLLHLFCLQSCCQDLLQLGIMKRKMNESQFEARPKDVAIVEGLTRRDDSMVDRTCTLGRPVSDSHTASKSSQSV